MKNAAATSDIGRFASRDHSCSTFHCLLVAAELGTPDG